MAGIKISALPAISAAGLTDVFPLVQAGVTYKCTLTQLFTLYNTNFFPVTLANGGSGAALTASNGGIVYSTATTMAILAGTATANKVLLSGASGAPSWSTVTYPAAAGWTTFTPTVTLTGGAGNTVPTFTTNAGRYSKVGNVVFVDIFLNNSAGGTAGAGTGQVNIALPVTAGATQAAANGICGLLINGAASYALTVDILNGATTAIIGFLSGTTSQGVQGATLNDANTRQMTAKFFYEI